MHKRVRDGHAPLMPHSAIGPSSRFQWEAHPATMLRLQFFSAARIVVLIMVLTFEEGGKFQFRSGEF